MTKARRYTDGQVRAMLSDAVLWLSELRLAASERDMPNYTSVTPIGDVLRFLRGATQRVKGEG